MCDESKLYPGLMYRRALFIEPKWAQFLASSGVTEAMGRPLAQPENEPGLLDNDVEKIV